jgi:hypothetical protein
VFFEAESNSYIMNDITATNPVTRIEPASLQVEVFQ